MDARDSRRGPTVAAAPAVRKRKIDIMDEDEHDQAELLFDAADFEAPPDGATLSDLRMPQEGLETFV